MRAHIEMVMGGLPSGAEMRMVADHKLAYKALGHDYSTQAGSPPSVVVVSSDMALAQLEELVRSFQSDWEKWSERSGVDFEVAPVTYLRSIVVSVARDGRVDSRGKEQSGDGDHWVRWEELP